MRSDQSGKVLVTALAFTVIAMICVAGLVSKNQTQKQVPVQYTRDTPRPVVGCPEPYFATAQGCAAFQPSPVRK